MVSRYASVVGGSLIITFGLLFAMQALIAIEELDLPAASSIFQIDYIKLIKDTEVEETPREIQRPEPPEAPPPITEFFTPRVGPGTQIVELDPIQIDSETGDSLTLERESDVTALVRVNPQYPARMAARGIEGWVEIEFAIGKAGNVVEPRVIASSNPGFERAALKAVRGWRYEPKMVGGKPVVRHGIRVRLAFELDQAAA